MLLQLENEWKEDDSIANGEENADHPAQRESADHPAQRLYSPPPKRARPLHTEEDIIRLIKKHLATEDIHETMRINREEGQTLALLFIMGW